MKKFAHLAGVCLVLLFLSAGHAAAQPASEESINVWSDAFSNSRQVDITVYTVPAGKQLIIDNISMRADVPAGEQVTGANINLPAPHIFVVSSQGTSDDRGYYAAGQATRIVVGPNQTIVFRVTRSHYGTGAYVFVSLAGRLVKN